MSLESFTERARKVIELASAEATRLNCDSVDTVHLLVGMLQEGQGVAANVLAGFDITAETILDVYKSFDSGPDLSLADVEANCLAELKWFNHRYVGTEHLLLGVCCDANCKASKLLTSIDKSPVELCKSVVELLGHGNSWSGWVAEHSALSQDE